MAAYAASGAEVTLVTCTLGEEGEIIPRGLNQLGSWAADQLGGYRAGELALALRSLHVTFHYFLGGMGRWRDSGMAGTPAAGHPRAFTGGSLAEQSAQLAEILELRRPEVVVTYDSSGGYGHPDHIRAHEITMAATRAASSVHRVFHIASGGGAVPIPDGPAGTTIDIRDQVPAKIAALRAHATQVTVNPPMFALSNGVPQRIAETERYALAHGPAAGADTDLFGGLEK